MRDKLPSLTALPPYCPIEWRCAPFLRRLPVLWAYSASSAKKGWFFSVLSVSPWCINLMGFAMLSPSYIPITCL